MFLDEPTSGLSSRDSENILDELHMIINTPSGMIPRQNENVIRTEAIKHGIPIMTTITGAQAAAQALQSLSKHELKVYPLQHYRSRLKAGHKR